jgi:hypothetical protein
LRRGLPRLTSGTEGKIVSGWVCSTSGTRGTFPLQISYSPHFPKGARDGAVPDFHHSSRPGPSLPRRRRQESRRSSLWRQRPGLGDQTQCHRGNHPGHSPCPVREDARRGVAAPGQHGRREASPASVLPEVRLGSPEGSGQGRPSHPANDRGGSGMVGAGDVLPQVSAVFFSLRA